jgi:DNA gyrase subunit A
MLERFRDHRVEVIVRRSRHQLEQAEAEKHIIEGLLAALKHIDEVIKIIRGAKDRPEASEKLQDRFGLSEVQADAILNMRLGKLTRLEQSELKARLAELDALIKELRAILKSEEQQLEVMLDELAEVVKRFGDARRNEILDDDEREVEEVEEEAADEDVVVTVSHEGFVKRMPMYLYRRRVASGKALAGMEKHEDDYIERLFVARTLGWILAFTEGGQCHFLPVQDLPESGRASRGQSAYSLLPGAERRDRIVAMVPVDDLEQERVLVFVTANGVVKRTPLAEFSNPRAGGIIAAGVKKGDRIIDVVLSDGDAELMILSREGRAIRFPETDVPELGRTAQGVKGMGLRQGDAVVGMVLIRREADVLTVSDDGMGKRTPAAEFPIQKRGGLGNLAIPSGEDARPLVGAMEVVDGDEVMLVTAAGQVTRVPAESVPAQGRRTRGGRLVELGSGDRVVEVTRAAGGGAPGIGSAGGGGGGDDAADLELRTAAPRSGIRGGGRPGNQSDLFG